MHGFQRDLIARCWLQARAVPMWQAVRSSCSSRVCLGSCGRSLRGPSQASRCLPAISSLDPTCSAAAPTSATLETSTMSRHVMKDVPSSRGLRPSTGTEASNPRLVQDCALARRPTTLEGLYSGLGSGIGVSDQFESKMKLLVEAPAAVEDALASLLDHHDRALQVCLLPQHQLLPVTGSPVHLGTDTRPLLLQQRALLTYINRIYFPFMVREPELGCCEGITWALWLHAPPSAPTTTSVVLGMAIVVPSLEDLPAGLEAAESSISNPG